MPNPIQWGSTRSGRVWDTKKAIQCVAYGSPGLPMQSTNVESEMFVASWVRRRVSMACHTVTECERVNGHIDHTLSR